jgi:hypothetical protein
MTSLLAGVCPLIPVPWGDDWVLALVRRAGLRRLFRQGGAEPSAAQLAVLTTDRSSWLHGCFAGLVLYPIKRIFRKVVFVFTIKDCVDAASRTFHEHWLIRHLLAKWDAGPAEVAGGVPAFKRLREALDQTLAETDPRPVEQIFRYAFRRGRRLALRAAAALGRAIRRVSGRRAREAAVDEAVAAAEARLEAGGDPEARALLEEVEARLLAQRGYLDHLEQRFLRHLGKIGESVSR